MQDGQEVYKKSSSIRLSCHGAQTLDSALISESTGSSEKSIQKTNKINIELSNQCNNKDKGNFVTSMLDKIRTKYFDRLIIGNLNINSLSSKFDQLKLLIQGKIDILIITETKLDDGFPTEQFTISGYSKPYRLDRNRNGGGVIIYIREDIPSKQINNFKIHDDIENIFIEVNLYKTKWLMCGCYHPPNQNDQYFYNNLGNALDKYSQDYERFLLIGDFNAEDTEPCLSEFLYEHNAENIVKNKTCFKSLNNPICIDLFLTNFPSSFQNTCTVTTGLSDFHKMVVTVTKMTFHKNPPKEIYYRDYKKFDQDLFREELAEKLYGCDSCKLYKKERKNYYNSLDIKNITDNKQFWKTIKPFLSEKIKITSKIKLKDQDKIISNNDKVAEEFSTFFENAVKSLNIKPRNLSLEDTTNLSNPVEIAIKKFQNHPSVQVIRENINLNQGFFFKQVEVDEILKEIRNLDNNKNGTFPNIPSNRLKEMSEVSAPFLTNVWNIEIVSQHKFSDNLKLTDVTTVFKKDDANLTTNYRPVSVLPIVSKIFERLLQKQTISHIDQYLSNFLCGYRQGYSTQTALISMLEKWRNILDNKGYSGAILMDLSRAFDTINHELLLAKLHAYGFSEQALLILSSYLSNRKQRVKINNTFSSWTDLIQGVPQGSVLGPLLFNIYLNDLIFSLKNINVCNFADNTTPYVCDKSIETVLKLLEENCEIALCWFENNYMKLNTDKCHLIVSGYKHEQIWAKIGNDKMWESSDVKLLGVTIDNELKFDKHVSKICSKASRKLSVLARMSKLLSFEKRRVIFKSFAECQFKYCPLIWMFHSRHTNNKINRLHERALRIVYNDYESTFEQLLINDKSFCIHHQNIHKLMIEIYKVFNNITDNIYSNIFIRTNHYSNLRSQRDLLISSVKSIFKGKNSLRYFESLMWNSLPIDIRNSESLVLFKAKIKTWKPDSCTCRLCKKYLNRVGFI